MIKVVETYFDEDLSKKPFFTGLVHKLEDGHYYVAAQDGYVQPYALYTEESFEELKKTTLKQLKTQIKKL